MPFATMIAGPNGSGKTTLLRFIRDQGAVLETDGFAGPNGSGKTTLLRFIGDEGAVLETGGPAVGLYINPDDIAATLEGSYEERVRQAQTIADEQRAYCLSNQLDFTFETVMSHPSKVEFFERAKAAGFFTVLYFISTQSADLNVRRVAERVQSGGHDVPEARIRERYVRAHGLLRRALNAAEKAFVYDNSGPNGMILGLVKSVRGTQFSAPIEHLLPGAPDWIRKLHATSTL